MMMRDHFRVFAQMVLMALWGTVLVSWQGDVNAVSYQIEQRLEGGTVWSKIADVPPSACTVTSPSTQLRCAAEVTTAWYTGSILVRFIAVAKDGTRTIRRKSGYWICDTCVDGSESPANVGGP